MDARLVQVIALQLLEWVGNLKETNMVMLMDNIKRAVEAEDINLEG